MSTQVSNNIGDFSKAVASPYSASLAELLNLIYNDADLRNKNYELQKAVAESEGKSAYALGEAQKAVTDKEAETMELQATGAIAGGVISIASVVTVPAATKAMSKNSLLSPHGEEIQGLEKQTNKLGAWDRAYDSPTTDPVYGADGAFVPKNYDSIDTVKGQYEELRSGSGKPIEDREVNEDVISYAKSLHEDDRNAFRKQIRDKKTDLGKKLDEETRQSHYLTFQLATQIHQGINTFFSNGVFGGILAAQAKKEQAEEQKLQAIAQYVKDRMQSTQNSTEQQNSDLYAQLKDTVHIMDAIAQASYRA